MSGEKKPPGAVEATLDDLPSVDTTNRVLKPVATITLDEEPPAEPSATQLLDPVIDDVPTDPKQRARPTTVHAPLLDVQADGVATQPKRRVSLKSDAFESAPTLMPAGRKDEDGPRGPPAAWRKTSVWTPGLVVLTAVGVAMLLLAIVVMLRS